MTSGMASQFGNRFRYRSKTETRQLVGLRTYEPKSHVIIF